MAWHRYGNFAPYVPTGTKIARGHAAAKKLAKQEGRSPDPVKIDGRKIARTFWGTKWCENLERYRDYSNRLPRGATYVRNGSVADLVIEPGRVRAVVGGSEAYTVNIKIKTLPPAVWTAIGRDCASEIESLLDLMQGRFSEGVMTRLTRVEDGLFPRPNEITMTCTCPDGAGVCKHIAATMYGVGSRLDIRPELLFTLRNVDHRELIGRAVSTANLDQSLSTADGMALSDGELLDIFGIEMEPPSKTAEKKPSRAAAKKKPAAKEKAQVNASQLTDESTKAVASPAVRKRRVPKNVEIAETKKTKKKNEKKKSSPQVSTSSAKVATRSKASAATSVHSDKPQIPRKSAVAKVTTKTAIKASAARTKSPVESAAKKKRK